MNTHHVRLAVVNCLVSNLCHYFGISHLGQVFLLPPDQEGGGTFWTPLPSTPKYCCFLKTLACDTHEGAVSL